MGENSEFCFTPLYFHCEDLFRFKFIYDQNDKNDNMKEVLDESKHNKTGIWINEFIYH